MLLTTQYLEEADKLADDIIVMDHGRMIAQGDADQLKDQVGGERIELTVEHATDLPAAAAVLEGVAVGDVRTQHQSRQLTAPITGGAPTLRAALNRLDDAGISVLDFGLRRPTLDDVFLSLTGRATEENPATQNTALGARR